MPKQQVPPGMQARREIEDEAIRLGRVRMDLDNQYAENTQALIDLFGSALEAGIPIDGYAKLVGVSRPTLYRWRSVVEKLRVAS